MKRPNVLLVTKGHPFDHNDLFAMFDSLEVDWTHVEQPAARVFFEPDMAKDYDALVMYDMPGIEFRPGGPVFEKPTAEYRDGLMSLCDAGKGLVFLHHALAGWPAWQEYAEIIGGRFLYLPAELRGRSCQDSGYRHGVDHQVQVLREHPVTAGLPEQFPMTDELYLAEIFEDSVEPLLASNYQFTAENFYSARKVVVENKMYDNSNWQHEQGSNLVGWLKSYRNSPVVYLQGGDDVVAYQNEHFQKLLENAIHWASSADALDWALQ